MMRFAWCLYLVLISVVVASAGELESDRTFMVGEDSYVLSNLYNGVVYLDEAGTEAGKITSAFYRDGYVYVFQNMQLCAFPMPSGAGDVVAQPVTIEDYSEGENHLFRFYFFGATDRGEIYAASYVHAKPGQTNLPFEIFLLNFDNGWDSATIVKHWELPLGVDSEWGPRNPHVSGDLATGNFTVAAHIWEQSAYNSKLQSSQYTTKIATWEVNDNAVSQPRWARAILSPSMVTPLDGNRVLIHDKQYWSNITPNYAYSAVPQVAEITDSHQLRTVSALGAGCTQIDKHSCGATVFNDGANTMMLYHAGVGVDEEEEEFGHKMALAYLPDGTEDLSTARELATLMNLDNVGVSALKSNDAVVSHVSASPLDDNRTLLLAIPYSHRNILGAYILSRTSTQTGIEPLIGTYTCNEYYTLEGFQVIAPTAPGFYIHRKGNQVEKIWVK